MGTECIGQMKRCGCTGGGRAEKVKQGGMRERGTGAEDVGQSMGAKDEGKRMWNKSCRAEDEERRMWGKGWEQRMQ